MNHPESPREDRTRGRTAYLAELQCFLCGSLAGSLESDRKPLPSSGAWHPANGGPAQQVADWRQLHCPRCGGALYVETVDVVIRHDEASEALREIPRRGRPPRWLIEERRQQEDSAETRP